MHTWEECMPVGAYGLVTVDGHLWRWMPMGAFRLVTADAHSGGVYTSEGIQPCDYWCTLGRSECQRGNSGLWLLMHTWEECMPVAAFGLMISGALWDALRDDWDVCLCELLALYRAWDVDCWTLRCNGVLCWALLDVICDMHMRLWRMYALWLCDAPKYIWYMLALRVDACKSCG